MKSKAVKSAFILTFGVLLSKAIGVFYRLPLSNILGAEGVGMYQLVFSVYGLIVTVIGSGLPIAVSRLTAESISKGKSPRLVFLPSIVLGLSCGLILTILVMFLSKSIAVMQGNEIVKVGYFIISPAIFFVSGLAVLKGYFQGTVNMFPTSLSYILEQVIKLVVGLTLAILLSKKGTIYAVCGSLIGVTLSEVIAFLSLLIIYAKKRDKTKLINVNITRSSVSIIKIALPITVGSMLIPLSQFVDSFIVVNLLSESTNITIATAMYGLYSGSVTPIVNMPIMLVLSLAMIIVPVVSKDRVKLNYNGILQKSKLSIKVCFIVGIPFTILLCVFANMLISIVYPRFTSNEISVASNLLQTASFSIVFYGAMQIETSLMQGLDKIYLPVRNILIALIIKEICCIILVKQVGIKGLCYSTIILSVIACLLNSISYHRLLGKNFKVNKSIAYLVVISYVFFAICIFSKYFIFNDIVGFLVASFVGGSIYYILIKNNKILLNEELKIIGINTSFNYNLQKQFYRSNYDYSYRSR